MNLSGFLKFVSDEETMSLALGKQICILKCQLSRKFLSMFHEFSLWSSNMFGKVAFQELCDSPVLESYFFSVLMYI